MCCYGGMSIERVCFDRGQGTKTINTDSRVILKVFECVATSVTCRVSEAASSQSLRPKLTSPQLDVPYALHLINSMPQ